MFVEVNHGTNKGDLFEDLRKRVVVAHQAGKGYKTISKKFGLHKSTVRQIMYKRRKFKTTITLPRSGQPTKITSKAKHAMVQEIAKDTIPINQSELRDIFSGNICVTSGAGPRAVGTERGRWS